MALPMMDFRVTAHWPIICLLLMVLAGCQHTLQKSGAQANKITSGKSLERWVETALTPYLVEQIGEHPRFRAQRIQVAKLEGNQPAPQMDALSARLREQINDVLLSLPSGKLAWQPEQLAVPTWDQPLLCQHAPPPHYLLGLEFQALEKNLWTLSVRALDLEEQSWVGGFGLRWRGRLTREQRNDLSKRYTDESLRGLRNLPFEMDQADLTARHLAHRLSCRLLQQQDNPSKLFLQPPSDDPFAQRTFSMLSHYLIQYREASIAADEAQADMMLAGELVSVDGPLKQLWVFARTTDGAAIPGLSAKAYVQLPQITAPQRTATPPDPEPVLASLATDVHTPPLKTRTQDTEVALQLLVPASPNHCRDKNPWRGGVHRAYTADRCFALELRVPDGAETFLIHRRADGSLVRLAPDRCRGLSHPGHRQGKLQTLRFPPHVGSGGTSILWKGPGVERFIALSLMPTLKNRPLRDHLLSLSGGCEHSHSSVFRGARAQQWLEELHQLARQLGPSVHWQEKLIGDTTLSLNQRREPFD